MNTVSGSADHELAKEATFGGVGIEVDRTIDVIDMSDFDARRDEIDESLWRAATETGFFQLVGHGIEQSTIDAAFGFAERFFALPEHIKAERAMPQASNSGWEFKTQRRPSTGTLDEKESFQVTRSRMDGLGLWPTEEQLSGFREAMLIFEEANHAVSMQVLSSFARRLGFPDEFFTERHDPSSSHYQSTLRLLHYLPMRVEDLDPTIWRAGAHTDYDCLTLLHQMPGQRGLQVSPGSEAAQRKDPEQPLEWTSIEPTEGVITCNIGDMLMRWSDEQLPSTLHRVRMPRADEYLGPRYSIAYFAQANRDAVIESPSGSFQPITAADYLTQRIQANFREA